MICAGRCVHTTVPLKAYAHLTSLHADLRAPPAQQHAAAAFFGVKRLSMRKCSLAASHQDQMTELPRQRRCMGSAELGSPTRNKHAPTWKKRAL